MPFDGHMPMTMTSAEALSIYLAKIKDPAYPLEWDEIAGYLAEALDRAPTPKAKARKADASEAGPLTAQALAAALAAFSGLIDSRTRIMGLSMVRLHSAGGILHIMGTDLDREHKTALTGCEMPDFDVLVAFDKLAKAVKGCTGAIGIEPEFTPLPEPKAPKVRGEHEEAFSVRVAVTCGGARTVIPGMEARFMPVMTMRPQASTMVDSAYLRDAFGFVQSAISTEETRYYLNGVFLRRETHAGESLTAFVACDGHRLSVQRGPDLEWGASDQGLIDGVIIPRLAVAWLLKNLPKSGELIMSVGADEKGARLMSFCTDAGTFTTRLIDGSFPDYQRAIPCEAGASRLHFADSKVNAARIAHIIGQADKGDKKAGIRLQAVGGILEAKIRTLDGGQSSVTLDALHEGPDVKIGANARYLLDVFDAGPVTITTTGEDCDPMLITFAGRPDRTRVLMPLRV